MDPSLTVHHSTTTTVPTNHHNLPRSAGSTPRSANQADCWGDDPLPQVPGAKLRLMCSYGGHIIPRPHDKSLCYMGGETRMVTVDRSSCLSDLCTRLSQSLLDGRQFTLKYQLPSEELDSLISLATDEDLENMIEEYDRLMAKPMGGGRLRLFLFLAKPETAKTMGVLLDGAKTETWFVDALNGADILNINRGLSDSAAIDDLLSLDSGVSEPPSNSTHQAHVQVPPPVFSESDAVEQPKIAPQQEIQSIKYVMSDLPIMETTTSSFDSSTTSPSMAHLPPICVKVDDGGEATRPPDEMKVGALEEQFFSEIRATTPFPTAILTPTVAVTNERSDHAAPVLSRKPPLPLPLQPIHQTSGGFNLPPPDYRHAGNFDLSSPDSIKSDSSIASTASLSKVAASQDHGAQLLAVKPNIDLKTEFPVPTIQNEVTIQPTQDPHTYIYQCPPPNHQQDPQNEQTHFIQPANMQYIPAHNPIQSCYHPLYPTQHPLHPHQQSPIYVLPVTQTQAYNLASVQATESTAVPTSSAPQAPTPVYPANPAGVIQVAANSAQFQQQYIGYSTAAQPVAVSAAHYGNYNCGHDHQQQQQHHVYYTGQMAASCAIPVVGSQYQSISPAQGAMIAEASMQLPTSDSNKQPPRVS